MNKYIPSSAANLTQREKEILSWIAMGLSSKQIAAKLLISESTVVSHRKNMLAKTGAKSSPELIYLYSSIPNKTLTEPQAI